MQAESQHPVSQNAASRSYGCVHNTQHTGHTGDLIYDLPLMFHLKHTAEPWLAHTRQSQLDGAILQQTQSVYIHHANTADDQ